MGVDCIIFTLTYYLLLGGRMTHEELVTEIRGAEERTHLLKERL